MSPHSWVSHKVKSPHHPPGNVMTCWRAEGIFTNESTHATDCCSCLVWSPLIKKHTLIVDPDPEAEATGVVKTQPDKESVSLLSLQLNPDLSLFIKDGNQIHAFLSAVVQGVFPCHVRLKGSERKNIKNMKLSSTFTELCTLSLSFTPPFRSDRAKTENKCQKREKTEIERKNS